MVKVCTRKSSELWLELIKNPHWQGKTFIKLETNRFWDSMDISINKIYIYYPSQSINVKLPICDMIKENESLVEKFNFYFLTPLSHNFKMLHVDANPITIGYLVTELCKI